MAIDDSFPSKSFLRSDGIGMITVLTNDLSKTLSWYVGTLGWTLYLDKTIDDQRLTVLTPPCVTEFSPLACLRIKLAQSQKEKSVVGQQAGDGTFLVVETDDWERQSEKFKSMGAVLVDDEKGRTVDDDGDGGFRALKVKDPEGNIINLVERTTSRIRELFKKDPA